MAQDSSNPKNSASPDLLKMLMDEDSVEISLEGDESKVEAKIESKVKSKIEAKIEASEDADKTLTRGKIAFEDTSTKSGNSQGAVKRRSDYSLSNAKSNVTQLISAPVPAQSALSARTALPAGSALSARTALTAGSAFGGPDLSAALESGFVTTDMRSVVQSEHMRIAQKRIKELEEVVESLRVDNEQLSAAGESLKNQNEDLNGRIENLESRIQDTNENAKREKDFTDASLKSRAKEISTLKLKVEELESRLHQDLRKIRVRERELENIIEIVRAEHAAVILNKDEMILSLKRKVDDLMHQMDLQNQRAKDSDRLSRDEHEKIKRTVKGLRAALIMLEGDEHQPYLKKVE